MPDALYVSKLSNKRIPSIPRKMKKNDNSFYPQIYGAMPEEDKTPKHKDAFVITGV